MFIAFSGASCASSLIKPLRLSVPLHLHVRWLRGQRRANPVVFVQLCLSLASGATLRKCGSRVTRTDRSSQKKFRARASQSYRHTQCHTVTLSHSVSHCHTVTKPMAVTICSISCDSFCELLHDLHNQHSMRVIPIALNAERWSCRTGSKKLSNDRDKNNR